MNLNILLVEDSPHDVVFISTALKQSSLQSNLSVVSSGKDCIKYLAKTIPDLIILDINMPVMDGIEVLKNIKTDPIYKRIPVVILTSSQEKHDILAAFDNYANSYVIKPMDIQSYFDAIKEIEKFWTLISETP
jgi:two-component system, chemotaxis family, response regulator Rcp1